MKKKIPDFEEAIRVIKIDEENYMGAYPLRLPMIGARGVYGGHTVAQTLLVAIESAPEDFVPHSFHAYFVKAGSGKTPMHYKVLKLHDDERFAKRSIQVIQEGKVRFNCIASLVKSNNSSSFEIQPPIPKAQIKYPDMDKLTVVHHTDYIRNAYSPEFEDFRLVPEENSQEPADRWIVVFSGLDQPSPFKNPSSHYVGMADLTDSAFLTTMARVLHLPWNPTENGPVESFDEEKDARKLMERSLNILHLFHYNAMSLDHHIYFHDNDHANFDMTKDWLCFAYQMRRLSNSRTLVRGHLFNKEGKCVATVVQEGLTYLFEGITDARL
ncbi:uncharacterized protein PRCAT00004749001 [Priceomyces carsonii]|uniref:uncharacterized protein n=1 Tax=Priceomyces carsonii TaxID=28549 RepID=UPI002EDB3059|nr:unnamed protein product [Priceomyces carsonii]